MQKATVLITAYERKNFVIQAINSVLNQTINNFDILVVLSNTFHKDMFQEYNNRIKIIIDRDANDKCDLLATGIKNIDTDIIMFLDDDDLYVKNKVEKIINIFENDHSIGFIHNNYEKIYENSNIDLNDSKLNNDGGILYIKSVQEALRNDCDSNTSSISIKKDIITKYLPILRSINGSDDTFFLYCALDSRKGIVQLRNKLTMYRIHKSGYTHIMGSYQQYVIKNQEKLQSDVTVHNIYLRNFKNKNLIDIQKLRLYYYKTLLNNYIIPSGRIKGRKYIYDSIGYLKFIPYSGNHPPRFVKYLYFILMYISIKLFIGINYLLGQYVLKGK